MGQSSTRLFRQANRADYQLVCEFQVERISEFEPRWYQAGALERSLVTGSCKEIHCREGIKPPLSAEISLGE